MLRIVVTVALIAFGVGAFFGAGPEIDSPINPFGVFFLGFAALAWFAWKPMAAGANSRPGILDAFGRNMLGEKRRKTSSS